MWLGRFSCAGVVFGGGEGVQKRGANVRNLYASWSEGQQGALFEMAKREEDRI